MELRTESIKFILPAVLLPPVLLVLMAAAQLPYTAALSMAVIVLALLPFFREFERARPRPRDLVPVAVMSALGALGRALFAMIPSFNPTSAIVMITGMQFGPQAGVLTGALAALASNMFLGQGPWTPWQMYAWGMIGFFAGIFQKKGWYRHRFVLYLFGMLSGILFGWFMDIQYIVSYVNPVTWTAVLLSYLSSFTMDATHGASTVLFLALLEHSWGGKLHRIKVKYGIGQKGEES